MAPRGRLRKGHKRIDAAIDALGQLGFSRDVVCKTVNELLKVYDGDDGWPFIEEASYKLVIETILEDQEEDRKEEEDEGETRELEVCEQGVGDGEASFHGEALANTPAAGCADGCISWKDISCTEHESRTSLHGQCQHGVATPGESGGPRSVVADAGSTHSHQPILPLRPRRRPCYGWISEDEEDGAEEPPKDADFVQKQVRVESDGRPHRERKRRSRWDERPLGF